MGFVAPYGQVGNRVSTDLSVSQATRDIVLGLGVTPQTYLTTAVAPGDLAVNVADPTQFFPGQLLSFYDLAGEEELAIAPDWSGVNPITMRWGGMDYAGFKYSHIVNTPVGTNLFFEVPDNIDPMLVGAAPLIYIVCLGEKDMPIAGHQIAPIFAMHLDYRRALMQPRPGNVSGPVTMDTNVWSMRQQEQCRHDVHLIAKAIRDNVNLETQYGENCVSLTDPLNPGKEVFSIQWNKVLIDPNTQHFVAQCDFTVQGFWEVYGFS